MLAKEGEETELKMAFHKVTKMNSMNSLKSILTTKESSRFSPSPNVVNQADDNPSEIFKRKVLSRTLQDEKAGPPKAKIHYENILKKTDYKIKQKFLPARCSFFYTPKKIEDAFMLKTASDRKGKTVGRLHKNKEKSFSPENRMSSTFAKKSLQTLEKSIDAQANQWSPEKGSPVANPKKKLESIFDLDSRAMRRLQFQRNPNKIMHLESILFSQQLLSRTIFKGQNLLKKEKEKSIVDLESKMKKWQKDIEEGDIMQNENHYRRLLVVEISDLQDKRTELYGEKRRVNYADVRKDLRKALERCFSLKLSLKEVWH